MPTERAAAFLERVIPWLATRADISGALLVGSQARATAPADEWSDVDLVVIAADPARYIDDASWLTALGSPLATFVERTLLAQRERRVLFADGLDVDFTVVSHDAAERFLEEQELTVGTVLRRGVVVLHDREGTLATRVAAIASTPLTRPDPPDAAAFHEAVNDFWYRTLWAARKLRRGELWLACDSVNGDMAEGIVRQLRWLAEARGVDTWHGARFLEQWAAPDVLARLRASVAPYDVDGARSALRASAELYRDLATNVAGRLGLRYPTEIEHGVRALLSEALR